MRENEYNNLIKANTKLVDEIKIVKKDNDALKTRINKAIEEIEYYDTLANHLDDEIYLDETLSKKLLEILKGEYIYE